LSVSVPVAHGTANTKPTFATILATHIQLNANATSVYLARGDGVHDLFALTISTADYNAHIIGNKEFTALTPPPPPPVPTHIKGATEVDIAEVNHQHKADLAEYAVYFNADKALQNQ
jgi:hypothetical protein